MLHTGHVRYLYAAKALGRSLVVGINSDTSVSQIKPQPPEHPTRPIIPENQRAEVVAALKPVDATVIFAETTADRLIITLKPDIYVKGGDYDLETLPETAAVRAIGGQVRFVRVEVPTSTSAIVDRILHHERPFPPTRRR